MVDAKPHLGYWGVRGLGNAPRLVLTATGVDFEDTRYASREAWFDGDKKTLDHEAPNLPYLTFDGVTVVEHDSICRIAAFRYKKDLLGSGAKEMALVENYFTMLTKANPKFRGTAFKQPAATADEHKEALETIKATVAAIDRRLGKGKWIASENVSIADIYFWEMLKAMELHHAEWTSQFENFARFSADFEAQDWFVAGKEAGKFIIVPFYPPGVATINNL
mgnify:CR=1 FL=1